MTVQNNTFSTKTLICNGLAVAFVAAFLQQILHEAVHGLTALAVGKDWVFLNLFASGSRWPGAPSEAGDALVAASAAVFNIFCGAACVLLFGRPDAARRPLWRLFLLYFGAYSIFAGFGYLMFDAAFFKPGGGNVGDWRKVIAFLGGAWEARLPIFLVGVAGSLYGFFWAPYSAARLGDGRLDKPSRVRLALSLLLVPYLVVNTVFTVLAIWHPLGGAGVLLVFFKYWFGYIGLFWGFFIAAYWADFKDPIAGLSPLPGRPATSWMIAALVALGAAVALLTPAVPAG